VGGFGLFHSSLPVILRLTLSELIGDRIDECLIGRLWPTLPLIARLNDRSTGRVEWWKGDPVRLDLAIDMIAVVRLED
jgi:hypothetical protein